MLSLIFILGIIISIIYIAKWYLDNKENKQIENNINFEELKAVNKETIGWLKVKGTNIEYAVVKTKNNSYYLNHNFEKEYNIAGWILADYKNNFNGKDKNSAI